MPELHSLSPGLSVLQDKGFKVALVTDGRMSGASGKTPAAIHVTPEAVEGGPLAYVEDGDIIRVDAESGDLTIVGMDVNQLIARPAARPGAVQQWGYGRELFGAFRAVVGSAERGASVCFNAADSEGDSGDTPVNAPLDQTIDA
jgi:phosphogluconate dehydratase